MTERKRFPLWLRKTGIKPSNMNLFIPAFLREMNLKTVCEHANCPNRLECYSAGSLTFIIMGENCTRNCKFCSVNNSLPDDIDFKEPANIAALVRRINIQYVIMTSVTRDDLPDGGAGHFVKCIDAIKETNPGCKVEVLVPDFKGRLDSIRKIAYSKADVVAHNMETVKSIFPKLRPMASYKRSLALLNSLKNIKKNTITKSGFMVGFGESYDEIAELLSEIRATGVDIISIGQYLKSHKDAVDVTEFIAPEKFYEYSRLAEKMGFVSVNCGPFVRSSYRAFEAYKKISATLSVFNKQ